MSKDWVTDIAQMHDKFDFRKNLNFNGNFLEFRKKFLEEELEELNNSIISADPKSVVDAIIDLCVVAIGTLDLAYVDVHAAWDEVLKKNLEKEKGHNSTRAGSEGFDLIKPDGWTPPDHTGNTGYLDAAVIELCNKNLPIQPLASHIETMVEYVDFAKSKNHDYNGDDPEFQHAAYYPNGISDIMYEISKKVKRIRRGIKRFAESGDLPKTDSLGDSFRDINIYSAIGATYMRGHLEGQSEDRDILNREIKD
jgi:hypothetical protein